MRKTIYAMSLLQERRRTYSIVAQGRELFNMSKKLIKITATEFDLLCYIREVARVRANGFEHDMNEMYVKVVTELLENWCLEEE